MSGKDWEKPLSCSGLIEEDDDDDDEFEVSEPYISTCQVKNIFCLCTVAVKDYECSTQYQ